MKTKKGMNIGLTGHSTSLSATGNPTATAPMVEKMLQDQSVWDTNNTVVKLDCNNLIEDKVIGDVIYSLLGKFKQKEWWKHSSLTETKKKCSAKLSSEKIQGLIVPGNNTNIYNVMAQGEYDVSSQIYEKEHTNSDIQLALFGQKHASEEIKEADLTMGGKSSSLEKYKLLLAEKGVQEGLQRTLGEACYIEAARSSRIPVWGICGGHQLIAAMHKNKVEFMSKTGADMTKVSNTTFRPRTKMYNNMVIPTDIEDTLNMNWKDSPLIKDKESRPVVYAHTQQVSPNNTSLPADPAEYELNDLNVTGWATHSNKTRVSSFETRSEADSYMMGTQFHPEMHYNYHTQDWREPQPTDFEKDSRYPGTEQNKRVVINFLDACANAKITGVSYDDN